MSSHFFPPWRAAPEESQVLGPPPRGGLGKMALGGPAGVISVKNALVRGVLHRPLTGVMAHPHPPSTQLPNVLTLFIWVNNREINSFMQLHKCDRNIFVCAMHVCAGGAKGVNRVPESVEHLMGDIKRVTLGYSCKTFWPGREGKATGK